MSTLSTDKLEVKRLARNAYMRARLARLREDPVWREKDNSRKRVAYHTQDRTKVAESQRARYLAIRDEWLPQLRAQRAARQEEVRAYKRAWYAKHRERLGHQRRIEIDAGQRQLSDRIRTAVCNSLRSGEKRGPTFKVLGYTIESLIRHLERQFKQGMTWDNYGKWHVDHIIPMSLFACTSTDDPDFKACWALSNLRPLWAVENVRKQAKRLLLV